MVKPTVVVVQLSDSFADLWQQLVADLSAEIRCCQPGEWSGVGPDAAVVVLAAGGAESEALAWLEANEPAAGVPVLAAGSDPGRRITARLLMHGASDYFALPEDVELLRNEVAAAVSRRREAVSRAADAAGEAKAEAFATIVGESAALKAVLARAARILHHADATALIVGETGTGKELLARAIHGGGPRAGGPFVPVNCSALPAHLVESELFGHERGAFTDAHAAKPGLFEMAEGGTLFLDEVGTLPVDVQAKLLRVLEDKEVRRVGATKWRRVDVRVLAAANEDLEDAIARGAFRRDLYFRLGVVPLTLPPLRDRGDDIVVIARDCMVRMSAYHQLPAPTLTPEARRALQAYSWPGNVRELKNAVERALLLSPPGELVVEELVPTGSQLAATGGPLPFPARLDDIAAAAARVTVENCHGNRSDAARRLGISRRRLRRLLEPTPHTQ